MDHTLLFAATEAPSLSFSLRLPLSAMHFLEFAVWSHFGCETVSEAVKTSPSATGPHSSLLGTLGIHSPDPFGGEFHQGRR